MRTRDEGLHVSPFPENQADRDFPVVQWLRLHLPMQGVQIPSLVGELRRPHASQPKKQNTKQKQYCNKFNKDFKNGPHQRNLKKKTKPSGHPHSLTSTTVTHCHPQPRHYAQHPKHSGTAIADTAFGIPTTPRQQRHEPITRLRSGGSGAEVRTLR